MCIFDLISRHDGTIFRLVGLGGSSPVWTPFAVSIVFGMGVASVMTLFMVPTLYSIFERK